MSDNLTTAETFQILKEATISEMKGIISSVNARSESEILTIKNLIQNITDDLEKLPVTEFQTKDQVKDIFELLITRQNSDLKVNIIKEVNDKVEQLIVNIYDESWLSHKIEDLCDKEVPNIIKNSKFSIRQLITDQQWFSFISLLIVGAFFVGGIWVQIFLMRTDLDTVQNTIKTLDIDSVDNTIKSHIKDDKENYKIIDKLKKFKDTDFQLHSQKQKTDIEFIKNKAKELEKSVDEHHSLIVNLKFENKLLTDKIKRICKKNDC